MTRLKLLLFVSLAVNLAMAGVIGGHWYKQREQRHAAMERVDERMTRELSPAGAERMRAAFGAQRDEIRRRALAARTAQQEVERLFTAETVDTAALTAATARARDAGRAYQEARQTIMIGVASDLGREDRQALVRALRHGSRGERPAMRERQGPGG